MKKFDCTTSAIYDVIMLNDFDTLRLFGEKGGDLNKCCLKFNYREDLYLPIHEATLYQKGNCVEVLLSFGVGI